MSSFWRKFRAYAQAGFAAWAEYRVELYLWALTGVFPIIMMGVWREAASRHQLALSPAEFTRYFLAVFLIRQLTMVWVIWEFESQVVNGTLSPLILQPVNPFWRYLVWHLTERVARAPFALLLLVLWFWAFPDALWLPSARDVLLASLAALLAFATRFIIQSAFSLVAFWSERASSLEEVWFLFYMFLSGMIAPLELFPPQVQRIVLLTPFPYLVYFPVKLLLGQAVDVTRGFIVLSLWGLLGFVLFRVLWRRGLRHYSAMGA